MDNLHRHVDVSLQHITSGYVVSPYRQTQPSATPQSVHFIRSAAGSTPVLCFSRLAGISTVRQQVQLPVWFVTGRSLYRDTQLRTKFGPRAPSRASPSERPPEHGPGNTNIRSAAVCVPDTTGCSRCCPLKVQLSPSYFCSQASSKAMSHCLTCVCLCQKQTICRPLIARRWTPHFSERRCRGTGPRPAWLRCPCVHLLPRTLGQQPPCLGNG
jgi:hypothetical protein